MAEKLQLGGVKFSSKVALRSYIRQVIGATPVGGEVEGGEARAVLVDLVGRHPDATRKLAGQVVSAFLVRRHVYGQKELWIRRADGSEEDISWIRCVEGKPLSTRAELIAAMRRSVSLDCHIESLRRRDEVCAHCSGPGEVLDHSGPLFIEIVEGFLKLNPPGEAVLISSPELNGKTLDPRTDYASRWSDYHTAEARYQILCKPCHKVKTANDMAAR